MKVSGISEQKDFAILEPGSHAAVCTQIIGLGMQERDWQGVITEKPIVKLRFEVPAERVTWTDKEGVEGEGPMVIWSTYNATLHENSKLRAHLVSWRGKQFTEQEIISFELNNVLGVPCMISVIHTANEGRTYANVDNVSRLMKGIDPPKAEGELITFDPYDHTPEELLALPNWLQELINTGKELEATQKDRVRQQAENELAAMAGKIKPVADKIPTATADEFADDDIPF